MTPEYQFYHGAILHEIVLASGMGLSIRVFDFHGRPDAYIINGELGLLIKHSTARITPWSFTFQKEHVAELFALRKVTRVCFVGFVCGEDGFVCVRDSALVSVLTRETWSNKAISNYHSNNNNWTNHRNVALTGYMGYGDFSP
jgi:hypothetical protein